MAFHEPSWNTEQVDRDLVKQTLSPRELKKGMHVQVRHNSGNGYERFWVGVTAVFRSCFFARVGNHLDLGHPFNYGDTVKFQYDQIVDVMNMDTAMLNALKTILGK